MDDSPPERPSRAPGLTVNDHVNAAIALAGLRRADSLAIAQNAIDEGQRDQHNAAAREFALSITHLEDALTRYNSARYRQEGDWHRNDPDKEQS